MDPHHLQNNMAMPGMQQNYQFMMQNQPIPQQPQPSTSNPLQFTPFDQMYQPNPQLNMFGDTMFMQPNQHETFQMAAQQVPQMYQQIYDPQMMQQLPQHGQHLAQHQQQLTQHSMHQQIQQPIPQQPYMQNNVIQPVIRQNHPAMHHIQETNEVEMRQQRLLAEQNRIQMEQIRKQEEAARRKHELEEAKRMEEMKRIEEEKRRRKEEEEEIKRIRRIEDEEKRRKEEEKRQAELRQIEEAEAERKLESDKAKEEMKKRSDTIPKPLSFCGTCPLTKLTGILPFPSEAPSSSLSASVCPQESLVTCLSTFDPHTIGVIAEALSAVDISHVQVRGEELREDETSKEEHPPLISKILEVNASCLSIDDEISNLMSAFDGADMDTSGASDHTGPSTSFTTTHHVNNAPTDNEAMRRMISLGKQPKGKGGNCGGRKKDMVGELFDSLTDYFDPSDGRRKRQRVKTYEEEQLETRELEMVAANEVKMAEKAREREKENERMVDDIEELEGGRFFDKKKAKKKEKEAERPPTPTEVLRQREEEWRERERKRHEKRKRRNDDEGEENWSNDVMAENESLERCIRKMDEILESIDVENIQQDEDAELPPDMLIENKKLDDLRGEVQKLNMYRTMNKVPSDRVIRLLLILEINMRDVVATDGRAPIVPISDEDCGEGQDEVFRDMIEERLVRGANAACTALKAIVSYKMSKTVFLEDPMERAVQVCKQYLTTIIFPHSDIMYQGASKSKKIVDDTPRKKRRMGGVSRSPLVKIIFMRMLELMGSFDELVALHTLPDTLYHQLNTVALSCFFVNNVAELQLKAMGVLANIFNRVDDIIRSQLISELLNSFHKVPPKSQASITLSNGHSISYSTCLFMFLIESSTKIPSPKRHHEDEDEEDAIDKDFSREDAVVKESFNEARSLSNKFIGGFLAKVIQKGGDDTYKTLFGVFLHDLLSAYMVPEWPVAEMILSVVAGYICTLYRSKVDVSVRCLIMEYLGYICSRLCKEKKDYGSDVNERLTMIVKTLIYYERDDERTTMDEIDVSHLSNNNLLRKTEQGLIDYLLATNNKSSEFSIEFAMKYYVGEWYRMTVEDEEQTTSYNIQLRNSADNDKDRRKYDRKVEKMLVKSRGQRNFLLKLCDKKTLRKRRAERANINALMLTSDVHWLLKHLSLQREFPNSFDPLLKQILVGVTSEGAVGLRTRAMKSLTQIIEVDNNILAIEDVRRSVHARMTDPNAQVREATIELLGKFIIAKPDIIQDYYHILIERIKDSGTSVRKRIIRIMREYCEKNPEYDKTSEMLSRIVRRVNDEEGVKKLVMDTMQALWMQPVKYKELLHNKVRVLTEVISILMKEVGGLDALENLFNMLLKGNNPDKAFVAASVQIVDSLFDEVIQLDMNADQDESLSVAERAKARQDKMLACLAGLSIFSKVRPVLLLKHVEALQPYLSMSAKTTVEQSVLNQVINMLERVIPLVDHPSPDFITRVDRNLGELVKTSGMVITSSAISCAAALYLKAPKLRPSTTSLFMQYLKGLLTWRKKLDLPGAQIAANIMPTIQRSVFALGLMARYYDWDTIVDEEEVNGLPLLTRESLAEINDEEIEKEPEGKRAIRDNVYLLLLFFSRHSDSNLRHKALTALGHLSAEYPEYLQKHEAVLIYRTVMITKDKRAMPLKIQALKNLEMFLLNEEKKAMKTNADWERIKDDQELKEMELAGSGLGSTVIQKYWTMVLEAYFNPLVDIRMSAMQVVWQTLSQGLVTPGNSIPVLIAMSTDPIVTIRHKVESLVKDIDNKYQGMVQSKAVQGVRAAFKLQETIKEEGSIYVRGIRAVDQSATNMTTGKAIQMVHGAPKMSNDGQALLSGLYQSLRANKQQRRSLVNSMLRLFTEDTKDVLSIEEWIFIADNLATFPYQVIDEPLYVCKSVENDLTIHGHSTLNQFMNELVPLQPGESTDEDVVYSTHALLSRFPPNPSRLYEIMDKCQAHLTLLALKNFLMKVYSITDARVQEYSTSDVSKGHEKGLGRKNVHMFFPQSSMSALRAEMKALRGTRDGNILLADQISSFRRQLLAIDNKDDEDDDEGVEKTEETANQDENDESTLMED